MNKLEFIENNLAPAIQIEGQTLPAMNIHERLQHHGTPGVSLAVIENGEIAFTKGYGITDLENGRPVTPQTLFQAASISKPVTALAAMALVQAGALDLDADVNTLLKSWQVPENEFTQAEKVTLRRLLSHNAGLTVHGFPGYAQGEPLPTLHQVLRGEPPANTKAVLVDVLPGSIWRYSGGGTTVAQLLMMEVTGLDFADLMQRYVLDPAGMVRSTYRQPLPVERQVEAAAAHGLDGKPLPGKWHTYPEQAAAGLWTTPEDLCKYIIAVQKAWNGLDDSLITQGTAKQMLNVQFKDWGIGPKISGEGQDLCFSHGGSNEGFRCKMMGFVHNGQGLAVMSNSDAGGSLCEEIIRAAALAYGWQGFLPKTKPTVEVGADVLRAYTGDYILKEMAEGAVSVTLQDGQLFVVSPGFITEPIGLYPESGRRFFETETGLEFGFTQQDGRQVLSIFIDDLEIRAEKP
jgi:CubicO group peptidase (beta-lactamase class C family)